ncbi:MAG: Gfo/Idh/MocA family oxidoreductase [Pseudomonadota bacterium]
MTASSYNPRLRFFEESAGQQHIADKDRYLYAQPTATHRLNIIGTGTIGQEHILVAELLGRATVNGVFDTAECSLETAIRRLPADRAAAIVKHKSLEAACQDANADALMICTPNFTHRDVLEIAAKSGKPIFVEKPMATTVTDAARMVELAESYGSFIQIGLQYRYKAAYVEARHEVLERRSIGDVRMVTLCEYRPPFLDKVNQWNKFARFSGGTLVEKCCHYFDLMNLFAGALPTRVFATTGQVQNFVDFDYDGEASDIDDHGHVVVDHANGVRSAFTLSMFAPQFHEEMIISGSDGRLVTVEHFDFHRDETAQTQLRIERGEAGSTRDVTLSYPDLIERSGHHGATFYEHAAFVDRLQGQSTNAATPLEGFWSIVTAAAAQHSAQSGQPVDVAAFLNTFELPKTVTKQL